MTETSPALTSVGTGFATLRSSLTFSQIDPPNKATEVFAITELFEEVLLQSSRKGALMCQRVNLTWRDTVVGSVKLQRYLFLAADKDLGVVAPMAHAHPSTDLILAKYVQLDSPEAGHGETHCQLVVPNPLLFFNTDLHNRGSSIRSPDSSYADLLAHGFLPFHNIDLLEGLFSGSLSHSKCLEISLTQPPACEISVELNILECNDCEGKDSCCFARTGVRNPKWSRVRDVFAAARSFHYKQRQLPGEEEREEITSISICFNAVEHGSRKVLLLLHAEDMRLAQAEALMPESETTTVEEAAQYEKYHVEFDCSNQMERTDVLTTASIGLYVAALSAKNGVPSSQ